MTEQRPTPTEAYDRVKAALEGGLKVAEHCSLNATAYIRLMNEALSILPALTPTGDVPVNEQIEKNYAEWKEIAEDRLKSIEYFRRELEKARLKSPDGLPSPTRYTDGSYSREYEEQPDQAEIAWSKYATEVVKHDGEHIVEYSLSDVEDAFKAGAAPSRPLAPAPQMHKAEVVERAAWSAACVYERAMEQYKGGVTYFPNNQTAQTAAMKLALSTLPPHRADSGLVAELVAALERASAGIQWYMGEFSEVVTDADHEMLAEIDAVLAKYAAQVKAGTV